MTISKALNSFQLAFDHADFGFTDEAQGSAEYWLPVSSAVANASRESERSRLRRMPRSTSARPSVARVIQAKSADSASFFSSAWMSVLRTSSGTPELRNM